MSAPLPFRWSGEAFEPLGRFRKSCDDRFVVGQVYSLEEVHERSQATHNHFFATIADYWRHLPERFDGRWPTPEHFRKWALIQVGYRDERSFVAGSKAEALRLAAFLRPVDGYSVVIVDGCVVTVLTAKSQSRAAMRTKEFQDSKEKVLTLLEQMVGVERDLMEREGEAA